MRFALAVWLVLLIALSLSPMSFKLKVHSIGPMHDFGHYTVYGLTAVLLWLITHRPFWRLLAFLGGIFVAVGQEWVENRLYHAGFEWRDVGTDLAGLISGFALMLLFTSLINDRYHE